jgi:DNA invertase Pin-like site-specific DNA recombinase
MLKEHDIALLSLEERIDTNSAAGELVFHVFGAIAHFERRLIAERTKDGIAAARARGKRPGRRPLDADKIAAALSLVKAGLSPTAAAKQLGLGRSNSRRRSVDRRAEEARRYRAVNIARVRHRRHAGQRVHRTDTSLAQQRRPRSRRAKR